MDHAAVAERFIAERYPHASIAVVGGSTARGNRTSTSDIDLLLVGDEIFEEAGKTSEASTHAFDGEIFEVFAYTWRGFQEWADRGVAQHRPVIVHMLVEGVPIRDDGTLPAARATWRSILDAGPSFSAEESAFRRYVITDLLDDLRDVADPLERRVLASLLFEKVAELMLLSAGLWIGAGKWLPRRLREMDRNRADRLSSPLLDDDVVLFATRAEEELRRAGGRVQAGFVR
jgi:hypothetical protein